MSGFVRYRTRAEAAAALGAIASGKVAARPPVIRGKFAHKNSEEKHIDCFLVLFKACKMFVYMAIKSSMLISFTSLNSLATLST